MRTNNFLKLSTRTILTMCTITLMGSSLLQAQNYPIVGTKQTNAYDNAVQIGIPASGDAFYGQNANYPGTSPSYTDNGDGTITDNITGLMWQKTADFNGDGIINMDDKKTYVDALAAADTFSLGGYNDWRLPSTKELYSLFLANGTDPSGYTGSTAGLNPFLDTNYFDFDYGDTVNGERIIDAQYATTTIYVDYVFGNQSALFGVNLADGRIKGYPKDAAPPTFTPMVYYVKYVRGNPSYGINRFHDNGDGTVSDTATGLMWMKDDNGSAILWEDALSYAENFSYAGYEDWRLPDIKELQSIIDYTRSPVTTSSAAIDPAFNCTQITNEGGNADYGYYWSSTTHVNWSTQPGSAAMYVSFGRALGWMEMPPSSGNYTLLDVHGAGAQRSDFKTGDPASFPYGHGPQGDVIRIYNYVRLVRNQTPVGMDEQGLNDRFDIYPNPTDGAFHLYSTEGISQINIYSAEGKLLNRITPSNQPGESLQIEKPGLYIIGIQTDQDVSYHKLVVE